MGYMLRDFEAGCKPPKGWDVANAVADGWTSEQITAFMRATVRPWNPEPPAPPTPDPEPEPPLPDPTPPRPDPRPLPQARPFDELMHAARNLGETDIEGLEQIISEARCYSGARLEMILKAVKTATKTSLSTLRAMLSGDDEPVSAVDHLALARLSIEAVGAENDDRRVVHFVESELPNVVNLACQAAVDASAPLYARSTALFRPVSIEHGTITGGVRRKEGATVLVPVDKPALVELLTALMDWRRYDARRRVEDPWKPISCPPIVAETILARRGDWPFPQLRAVVSAPTLRPDGTILDQKGYDASTGILFASDLDWPALPDRLTEADAKSALSSLRDLICTFPFVTPADQSGALAMLLTAIVRPCLTAAPMFGISAPTPGTGKSKLVDIASILATGQAASVLSAPREEAELQKQVGAALMAGDAFITLDNIEYPLRSEFLCQVMTQGSVSVRVLGESRNMKLPTASTFCATGNSLRFAGDLTRRVVLVNLDARVERPEERVFPVDATAVAKSQRVPLVTAALTILRAFVVHRGPKIVPALGSFEGWSNLVRSALVWLGEADPMANGAKVREDDPERERIARILAALPSGTRWTAREIGRDVENGGLMADALGEFIERNGKFNKHGFGNYIRKHSGRIIDGRRIVQAGKDERENVALWTVENLSSPDPVEEPDPVEDEGFW